MYFNTATKYVATIDENKKDVKHAIETLDDIYNYEDDFFKAIACTSTKIDVISIYIKYESNNC